MKLELSTIIVARILENDMKKFSQNLLKSRFPRRYAFGTETTFGRNYKIEVLKLEWSTFIVAKFLNNDVKKC